MIYYTFFLDQFQESKKCPRSDSNAQSQAPEACALSIELRGHINVYPKTICQIAAATLRGFP